MPSAWLSAGCCCIAAAGYSNSTSSQVKHWLRATFSRSKRLAAPLQTRAPLKCPESCDALHGPGFGLSRGYTYTRLVGNHKPPPVRVSFTLALSPAEAFTLIRNPRLLDDTTPLWFRLVIREHSKEAVADFLENSEPDKDLSHLQLPLHIDYWMLAFALPFPWRSRVTECAREGKAQFRLTYEQAMGPFLGFVHSHVVSPHAAGCRVDDTIEFDVTSEPIVNTITWHVLTFLLQGRCRNLNESHGGHLA
ncbi:unnamed protein product [Effrenium voratum]|nr:unnamed protein product [Effrenium voratum]